MNNSDTALAFHDLVTNVLVELAADDDAPDDELVDDMRNLTDLLFEALNFKVVEDGKAEISL
jgi:hypothetical protein